MTDRGPLDAVSPLDGRYARTTEPLIPYASERALMRARVHVEVEYLIALATLDATPLSLDDADRELLRDRYREFDGSDAELVKQLETEGNDEYAATNHDVKAVEYFVREGLPEGVGKQWIHFGLTSEDVNNLAYRLLLGPAVGEVLVPELQAVRDQLAAMAREYRDVPMLARTHGQPATPTTFGKELAVYASRLGRTLGQLDNALRSLSGKLAGASGTYAAHRAAYPDVDWPAFARTFVTDLGLVHEPLTTQVNPCDDLAALFDALRETNNVLLDLAVDMWLYISDRYLGQETVAGETGSSTMPHKVNPIDFENAEGNLSKANSDLAFLGEYITRSRLQRDLSDSTVKRNSGAALAHCLLAYEKLQAGLDTVVPNEQVMREDLEETPEILGEAVQTVLRREGHGDAYERVKDLTRGQHVTLEEFQELFRDLDLPESVREELLALTPAGYTGVADALVDELDTGELSLSEAYVAGLQAVLENEPEEAVRALAAAWEARGDADDPSARRDAVAAGVVLLGHVESGVLDADVVELSGLTEAVEAEQGQLSAPVLALYQGCLGDQLSLAPEELRPEADPGDDEFDAADLEALVAAGLLDSVLGRSVADTDENGDDTDQSEHETDGGALDVLQSEYETGLEQTAAGERQAAIDSLMDAWTHHDSVGEDGRQLAESAGVALAAHVADDDALSMIHDEVLAAVDGADLPAPARAVFEVLAGGDPDVSPATLREQADDDGLDALEARAFAALLDDLDE